MRESESLGEGVFKSPDDESENYQGWLALEGGNMEPTHRAVMPTRAPPWDLIWKQHICI